MRGRTDFPRPSYAAASFIDPSSVGFADTFSHKGRRSGFRLYFGFLAAWTSISTSMPAWTRPVIWLVMREGLLGCSAVPK